MNNSTTLPQTRETRGKTLIENGYKIVQSANVPDLYFVYPPTGCAPYAVDTLRETCTCRDWTRRSELAQGNPIQPCKHLVACLLQAFYPPISLLDEAAAELRGHVVAALDAHDDVTIARINEEWAAHDLAEARYTSALLWIVALTGAAFDDVNEAVRYGRGSCAVVVRMAQEIIG